MVGSGGKGLSSAGRQHAAAQQLQQQQQQQQAGAARAGPASVSATAIQKLGPGCFVSLPASGPTAARPITPATVIPAVPTLPHPHAHPSPPAYFHVPSPSPPLVHALGVPHSGLLATAAVVHSPMPIALLGGGTSTPVSEALGSANWLRAVTGALKPGPSPTLQRYFAACVPNPGPTIATRVREMTEAVLPNEAHFPAAFQMAQPSINAYRREEVRVCVLSWRAAPHVCV